MSLHSPTLRDDTPTTKIVYVRDFISQMTFAVYVDDDRYSIPTLHLVVAADQGAALAVAQRLIAESPHHLGAELCLDGERLAGLGTFAARRAAQAAALG